MGAPEDEIKAAVARELALYTPGALTLFEVGLCQGQVRADIVSLSAGCFRAIEVKSAVDSLRRLPEQVRIYSQVADACTLVVAEVHAVKAQGLVPPWWGLWSFREGRLELARVGDPNPTPDALAAARLLWRPEALAELRARGLAKGLSRKCIGHLHRALVEAMPQEELRALVRRQLLARTEWTRIQPQRAEAAA